MKYHKQGEIKLTVQQDRFDYGMRDVVLGRFDFNGGSTVLVPAKDGFLSLRFALGPCLAEDLEEEGIRKHAPRGHTQTETIAAMINPSGVLYTLKDGQRILFIKAENTQPVLVQIGHASWGNKQWSDQFPAEVWEEE